ncbi:DUF4269 domain-containing protein [Bacillus carboniphilus]|uniref:DUF4269 domain-containing protein n=1 Tax=Bacillus carboniphilus TaxID=86663 RepID=A0ABN0WIP7_9BACI
MDFHQIDYLKTGNQRQKDAYRVIQKLNIMDDLSEYNPLLCGTIPINLDIKGSDLDMIMEVSDFNRFESKVAGLYSHLENFKQKRTFIRNRPVIKANFFFEGFEFELFGQSQTVEKQYAYLHMIIEHALINENPTLRDEVIALKKKGYKTEPAFCHLLGLEGDPYDRLIEYGKEKKIIS